MKNPILTGVLINFRLPKPKTQTPQKPGQLRKSISAKAAAKSPTNANAQRNAKNNTAKTQKDKKRKWWKFFLS